MIPEIGHFCLLLSLAICLGQIALPFMHRNSPRLGERAVGLAVMQATLMTVSFLALIFAFIESDFSVLLVYEHSHTLKPLLYKITGTWGNHEGSMLLWAWLLSVYGLILARQRFADLAAIKPTALAVQAALTAGFVGFILFPSNPFWRIYPVPLDGTGLNPMLQDIGLAIHPPILYQGYVGFAIVFALAVAALWHRQFNAVWSRFAARWVAFSWGILSLGIGLGSWWAYRELGWGGWWFWDPVENVSLMPWLLGTALLHLNLMHEKTGRYPNWTSLLAILTFTLSLMGTFIVRSGLLTSVHAFASDPDRGIFILLFFAAVAGGALVLWGMRQIETAEDGVARNMLSRETLLLINSILLVSSCATILLATLYPMLADWLGWPSASVGPAYFNKTVLPLLAPLLLLGGFAPLLPWHRGEAGRVVRAVRTPLLVCAIVLALLFWVLSPREALWWVGVALGLWLVAASALYLHRQAQGNTQRLRRLPMRGWGTFAAHLGAGIFAIALTVNSLDKTMIETPSEIGQSHAFAGYDVRYSSQQELPGSNFIMRRAEIDVSDESGNAIAKLHPETRFYPVRGMMTTEAAIDSNWARDLYVAIGQTQDSGEGLRVYLEPFTRWLWIGFALMGLGGILASVRPRKGGAA